MTARSKLRRQKKEAASSFCPLATIDGVKPPGRPLGRRDRRRRGCDYYGLLPVQQLARPGEDQTLKA